MAKTYNLQCDPVCGFNLTSHNRKEVERMGMEHVIEVHPDMNMSTKEVKKMVKEM